MSKQPLNYNGHIAYYSNKKRNKNVTFSFYILPNFVFFPSRSEASDLLTKNLQACGWYGERKRKKEKKKRKEKKGGKKTRSMSASLTTAAMKPFADNSRFAEIIIGR